MTTLAATTTRASLALLLTLSACGGGGAAAPAADPPAAARPARNAAGRPTTREELADMVQGAIMRNAPGELTPLLITEAELRASCRNADLPDLPTDLRDSLASMVKACHDEVDWTSAKRLAIWGGHPRPPFSDCRELGADTPLDVDVSTHAEPLTL
ncbi:MAG TPA: hypothetical protein VL172_14345, partial [Kofleriaceae bacterium]|nr:hypothetical protein [Kofleriaceae bacterium]